jgi:multidrug efflux system membrane fusion protein
LDSLLAQRPAKAAKVAGARLDMERCTVVAPFDGYVTNLNISEGEIAKPGIPLFTLIDARKWYVVANYRESELKYIAPGMHVDLYLMGNQSRRFDGVVESMGNGVSPDDTNMNNGLPQIDHTLNWVHLAARFPVRVRVVNPDPALFRMGETAISIVR